MPDKRPLEGGPSSPSQPPLKKPTQAPPPTAMSGDRIIASLPHPLSTSSSTSPFTTPPAFQQPSPLCSFSFDSARTLHHDDRCKRYYRGPPPYHNRQRGPPLGADLNYGLERFTQRDEGVNEHLDALVFALQHRTESAPEDRKEVVDEERKKADVITWRGIITKICTAYNQSTQERFSDPLDLNAMMVDGTLYLEEYSSPSSRAEKARKESDPKMRRFGYYGYSFESYCIVDSPSEVSSPFREDPPGWSGDVNTNVQWCQVVRTKLGPNRLIIGGEVDASSLNGELVELKTSMQLTSAHVNPRKALVEQERFEKKLLKFFLQSYLLGISKIVVGFRDYQGFLRTHQEFKTLRIPRMVRAGQPIPGQPVLREKSVWEPKDSLGFGDQILSFIRSTIEKQGEEGQVFRITFHAPFKQVELRLLTPEEVKEEVQDGATSGERNGFLPKEYWEFVQSRASKT